MKILVIGSESAETDSLVTELANKHQALNHGLVSDRSFNPPLAGYYHTSVVDLTSGDIVELSAQFDKIIMLDQPKESYPHFKSLVTTLRLMYDLEQLGRPVEYQQNKYAKIFLFWKQYLKQNKSFCYAPFTTIVDNAGSTTICAKSWKPLHKLDQIKDWKTDSIYQEVRTNMLSGITMPDRCRDCYSREQEGLSESARQFETLEWAINLAAESPQDFVRQTAPYAFEIRPSNKCNIMCRTCDDGHSHLLEREWKTIGMPLVDWRFSNTSFDLIDFSQLRRIYVGGGEPTVMPEFYQFLENCIKSGHTNFELLIGTNGVKFSNKLVALLDHFKNVTLAFSYDGYGKVNDYIRWGSEFDVMVANGRMLRERGHTISLQTVFSIWNAATLHRLFEFYDTEYPDSGLLFQIAEGYDGLYQPYNHPRPDLVRESLKKCQQTKIYYTNGRSAKELVNQLLEHYSDPNYKVDIEQLARFYEFNDKLDNSRGCKLENYVPELAQARREIWPT